MYTTLSPLLIGERVTLLKDLKARDEKNVVDSYRRAPSHCVLSALPNNSSHLPPHPGRIQTVFRSLPKDGRICRRIFPARILIKKYEISQNLENDGQKSSTVFPIFPIFGARSNKMAGSAYITIYQKRNLRIKK